LFLLRARTRTQAGKGDSPTITPFDYDTAIAEGEVDSLHLVMRDANRLQDIAVEKSGLGMPRLSGFDVIQGVKTILPVPMPIGMAASRRSTQGRRRAALA
jgi:beta-glucosidase